LHDQSQQNKGSILINAENLLADLQNRTSGCLQTVEDQQSRGASGNSTFSKDTFYTFVASLTYVFIYWGMSRPFQVGQAVGPYSEFQGKGGGGRGKQRPV